MNQKQSWNIITLFLILIFGFTIATILKMDDTFSEQENRTLAQRPAFSFESLLSGEFTKDYEAYLTDQFVMRDEWIGVKTKAEQALGKTDINDIYFAADDYLIEKHTGVFESDRAAGNIQILASFLEKETEDLGAEHVTAMIVPNAVDILRDKLPAFASPYDEEEYLARIQEVIPENVWFDASSVLNAHKEEEIYYRTDHHWKSLGAYYTFAEWAKEKGIADVEETGKNNYTVTEVTDSFRGTIASKVGIDVRADSIERYDPAEPYQVELVYNQSDDVRSSVYQSSALEEKDKYEYFYGGNYSLIEGTSDADSQRKLLVIKDSYANCFVPFLYPYFQQVDMIDLRYFYQSLSEFIEQKGYTDILVLYNAAGFAQESSLLTLGS